VFGFTLKQPPHIIYLIFACVGLGMASPYLMIGMFPQLIRLLPKPGMWMDTFKQAMGFVLLGTVVFIFSFMDKDYLVPTFAMLIGIWAGCWWIGRTHLTAELGTKLLAWGQGIGFAAVVGWVCFTTLTPHPDVLKWEPFSSSAQAKLVESGKTVMVDFTADWCASCKVNLKFAINTEDVARVVRENGVVPMIADYTNVPDEISSALKSLHSKSIPVLAIFPADHPDQVYLLRDLITKGQVIDALKKAGPSRDKSSPVNTAQASAH
jgi:thiol:disulfide interchange protein